MPSELEQRLAMNRARRITYEQVRSEMQANMQARRSQFAFKTVVAKSTSDPMDVASFGKCGRKAGKARKGKVMARTARQEAQVKIRVIIRNQARTLFVGTVVRKAT